MKTKHNTGITKLALCAPMIALLAACSHQPSESDAKAVIKQRLGDCKYFSLDKFSKTNGIPVDQNNYKVEVKYTLMLSAEDSGVKDQLKDLAKLAHQYADVKADFDKSNHDSAVISNEYIAAHPDDHDASIHFNEVDPGIKKREAEILQMQELEGRINQNTSGRVFRQKIISECPGVGADMYGPFFSNQNSIDALADESKLEFTETLPMSRTDAGWQEAR